MQRERKMKKQEVKRKLAKVNQERLVLIRQDVAGLLTSEEKTRLENLEEEATRLVESLKNK